MDIDINEQIKCVRREINMRESAYPRWVEKGRMKQVKADQEIAAMKAVEQTLLQVMQDQEFKLS